MLSATIGGRARAVLIHDATSRVVSPAAVGDEVLEHLPGIARKRHLDLGVLLPVLLRFRSIGLKPPSTRVMKTKLETKMTGLSSLWRCTFYGSAGSHLDSGSGYSVLATLTTGDILDHLGRR